MRKLLWFILIISVMIACKSAPSIEEQPTQFIRIIDVIEPEFEVESIYIIKADLVVTEFEAIIRINNPNIFDIELSSISYELYGNGEFWADGLTGNILNIPALSSGETRFTFSMNFINMSRRLLDEVINLRRINYRFNGQALMKPITHIGLTGSFAADVFTVDFDCTGYSEVKPRAD